jgi:glycosyltransferase involved in cell wall biosynthesis
MRFSVVIASLNEADRLWKTVRSVRETTRRRDYEIVVTDDASTDGCLDQLRQRYDDVRIVGHRKRKGCSPTKDLGARSSTGDVIVFLDGHCKPERGAIETLVEAVEPDGRHSDSSRRSTRRRGRTQRLVGQCYSNLTTLDSEWIGLKGMRMRGRFYESPALAGAALR